MNWVTRVRNAIPFIAKRETAERVSAAKLLAHANWATAEPVLLPLILQDPAQ